MTVWHTGDSIPYRGSSWEDNERERTPETLLNYWASLTRTNLSFYLGVGTRSLLRRPKWRAQTGVRRGPTYFWQSYYYENTRTLWTTRGGQGYHHLLPTIAVPWGGTHFLASTESDTTFALSTRISLEAFKRNPPQPSELTWVTLVRVRKPIRLTPTIKKENLNWSRGKTYFHRQVLVLGKGKYLRKVKLTQVNKEDNLY